jgi:hypothetical protein
MSVKSYWVVSPNVRNNEATVSDWRQASVLARAAFMGWKPDNRDHKAIGYKFAHVIKPGDVILIARRHKHEPEVVGFGVVNGKYKRRLSTTKAPEYFGSLRSLSPFVPLSRPPRDVPLAAALRHTTALALLHPSRNKAHARLCKWIDVQLERQHGTRQKRSASENNQGESSRAVLADPSQNHQLDYEIRSKKEMRLARKREAELMQAYRDWLQRQHRQIQIAKYHKLECDGFEKAQRNLVEAKASSKREHIRMAVGQLLDYAYQGRKQFGWPNMAILVPEEPSRDIQDWLKHFDISVIWRQKGVFLDNANGQFT